MTTSPLLEVLPLDSGAFIIVPPILLLLLLLLLFEPDYTIEGEVLAELNPEPDVEEVLLINRKFCWVKRPSWLN